MKVKNRISRWYYIGLLPFLVENVYAYGGIKIENGKLTFSIPSQITNQTGGEMTGEVNNVLNSFGRVIFWIEGFAILALVVGFAWVSFMLAVSPDSPGDKKRYTTWLMRIAISAVGLGGLHFILSLLFNLLK